MLCNKCNQPLNEHMSVLSKKHEHLVTICPSKELLRESQTLPQVREVRTPDGA